jgi:heme A synthase
VINQLLIRKMLVAFLVAFVSVFITALEGLSKEPNYHWSRSFVIGLVVGAIAAGLRAVLALAPINLVPSDSQHSIRLSRRA